MRKIYLFKCFEKAEKGNYPVATIEFTKDLSFYDFVITNVENLKAKREFYYQNLDDLCTFKNNKNKTVIAVYEGIESIEIHRKDYLNISRDS